MSPLTSPDSKPLFDRGPSLGTRFALLAVLSLALMLLDHQQHHLETVRRALSVAVYPIRVLVDLPSAIVGSTAEHLAERNRLVEENRRLRTQNLRQQARLQRLTALEAENARLRALMETPAKFADRIQVAEILSVDLDPYRHRIALNRGSQDGVFLGQALLDADGVVGQVTRVDTISSEAILISDPSHATPVEIHRNGLRTVAIGTGDVSRVDLPFLPNSADVQVGDMLLSSGLGEAFPAGYPVARVSRIDRRPGEPFARIEAEPTAALNRDREVLLVWQGGEEDEAPGGGMPDAREPSP